MDTNKQQIEDTLKHIFGECVVREDEHNDGYYVEVKDACVMVLREPVEQESISGPLTVMGWSVGVVMPDGEYASEVETTSLWTALGYAAEALSDQIINNLRWSAYAREVTADA
jgi:hypothetical protein